MKLRIKFSKKGYVKFVGHLDGMRYFQKAIRRANLPARYSEGFSPHMVMSFAAPLGVGLESNGEYMDIELTTAPAMHEDEMIQKLNDTMAEGYSILSIKELPDTAKNAMSIVAAADYRLFFKETFPIAWEEFAQALTKFYQQSSICITKATKKSEREVDIRPLMYQFQIEPETKSIFMQLSTGSANNLKPELVMDAFMQYSGMELPPFSYQIRREEVYGFTDKDMTHFIPLEAFGQEF